MPVCVSTCVLRMFLSEGVRVQACPSITVCLGMFLLICAFICICLYVGVLVCVYMCADACGCVFVREFVHVCVFMKQNVCIHGENFVDVEWF